MTRTGLLAQLVEPLRGKACVLAGTPEVVSCQQDPGGGRTSAKTVRAHRPRAAAADR